ncbi:MAG: hypothetical protein DI537_13995 [Stutzerimonas stutzeri]|nr:MAG: hypothetical protein DI537_13995 [Stutzerimonas stutzeri]
MDYVRKMLEDASAAGLEISVECDGDVDYRGTDAAAADEAVRACDEMSVHLKQPDGKTVGWALIINELAEDERIADTSGVWMSRWWEENVPC